MKIINFTKSGKRKTKKRNPDMKHRELDFQMLVKDNKEYFWYSKHFWWTMLEKLSTVARVIQEKWEHSAFVN